MLELGGGAEEEGCGAPRAVTFQNRRVAPPPHARRPNLLPAKTPPLRPARGRWRGEEGSGKEDSPSPSIRCLMPKVSALAFGGCAEFDSYSLHVPSGHQDNPGERPEGLRPVLAPSGWSGCLLLP